MQTLSLQSLSEEGTCAEQLGYRFVIDKDLHDPEQQESEVVCFVVVVIGCAFSLLSKKSLDHLIF